MSIAVRKPNRENITPPADTAANTPSAPMGAKPKAVKLALLNPTMISAIEATTGMTSFQAVIAVLARASQRTPARFTSRNTSSSAAATASPLAVSTRSPASLCVSHGRIWQRGDSGAVSARAAGYHGCALDDLGEVTTGLQPHHGFANRDLVGRAAIGTQRGG